MEQLTKNQAVATSQEAVQNQNEPQLRDENAHNDKSVHGVLNPTCSKHITLNATGGGFLTASKQFRHGATSKSRSNTASNSTKHKSPHLSGWRQIISLIT